MKQASYLFLVAAIIGGFLAGYYALFSLLAFTALYFIYSVPPTRFKRIPFFSSFLISLCVLSESFAGFFLISNSKIVSAFPNRAIFGLVAMAFLWSHIRDLKDIEGDRQAGINTVPVLFNNIWGENWGERIVAIFASSAFLLAPIFINLNILWFTAAPAAIATYYFCIKKPYREFPIFIVYFLFVVISLLILFLSLFQGMF